MGTQLWAKMHGAAVHFPIALVMVSFALDGAGRIPPSPAMRRNLHSAAYWSLLLGAASTVPAVVSGLVLSRGVILGHGPLRMHHLFAWPTFALIVATATWRALGSAEASEPPPLGYMAAAAAASALVAATGYWGGEMLIGG